MVFGATGQQGGSVANFVLSDPELSKQYKVRGVTRDVGKDAAKALQSKGAEVVQGDADDQASLNKAVQGAHTVFAMTQTVYDDQTKARDTRQSKAMADAAVAAGAQYFIYSTECHAGKVSNGKYPVDSYDAKADAEEYIRTLPIKSAFFAPGSFMQNFMRMMAPRPAGDGTYAISNFHSGDAKFPFLDVAGDSGKFVGAILANPDAFVGKTLSAADPTLYSLNDVAQIMSQVTGKTVKYNQIPEATFKGYCPPAAADGIANMFLYIQDFGYYGAKTKEVVEWSATQARGRPTTVKQFVQNNPPQLA